MKNELINFAIVLRKMETRTSKIEDVHCNPKVQILILFIFYLANVGDVEAFDC